MRDYQTLHFKTQIKAKEQCFHCCSTYYSHSKDFNNENNSNLKKSLKIPKW